MPTARAVPDGGSIPKCRKNDPIRPSTTFPSEFPWRTSQINQTSPHNCFLFFFIESYEAQDNSDKSGQIPNSELPKIPTKRLRFKIALFFRKRNSVTLQNAATSPRETTSSTMDINAHCALCRRCRQIFNGELQVFSDIRVRERFETENLCNKTFQNGEGIRSRRAIERAK
ncbi:hypothetical protein [Pandoraea apista]|uniref:hypothetical protein n=1 Tax=Pandoraea apista TaxID=93218 RepID=UPI00248E540B|nr:hypothetical protein [Pandoraea apista]